MHGRKLMHLKALSQIWKKIELSYDALPGELLHLVVGVCLAVVMQWNHFLGL